MKKLISIFAPWLPLSAAIVFAFGFMYIVVQQSIRRSADDVPYQYARDIKTKLEDGMPVFAAVSGIPVTDMQKSTAPFVIVCDENGAPVAGTVVLHGKIPAPPTGSCIASKPSGEHHISWQPEENVRNATVILPWSINGISGYVIGGQSLRATEQREAVLVMQIAAGLLCTLFTTFIVTLLVNTVMKRINKTAYA